MAPEGLREDLLKAIKQKGWNFPTPVQRRAIPLIMDRHDVVGTARTGAGKTGAFVIPMIDRLRQHSMKMGARALVFAPSRELAMQTYKAVKDLGRVAEKSKVCFDSGSVRRTSSSCDWKPCSKSRSASSNTTYSTEERFSDIST